MTTRPKPPSLARKLLSRALPADMRDEVLGDLEEEFCSRRDAAGWYWRQAVLFSLRYLLSAAAETVTGFLQPGWTQDFRHAIRSVSRSWGFSLTIVAILGIGIGAATAIFSIFYGILLRPFPYRSPDSLVRVDWIMPTGQSGGSSLGDFELWKRASRSLSEAGVFSTQSMEIYSNGPAETVQVTYLSSGALSVLGVSPQLGRLFTPAEDIPNGDVHKAILSDSLWERRFGRDPGVIGRTVRKREGSFEIVGVMPRGFAFPARTEMWVPVESVWANSSLASRRSTSRTYAMIARLSPGSSLQQARDELRALSAAAGEIRDGIQPRVRSFREAETGQLQPYLIALLGGVGCLVLICIANVSSLQLARGAARQREFAVRAAIGASVGRNLRIQFAESILLALSGACLGCLVAIAGVRIILSRIPVDLPSWMDISVDTTALAFCFALAGIASVVSGLLPAWRAAGRDPHQLLRSGGRGPTDRAGLRQGLVIGEIGLSTMLLVSALLMIQTLQILQKRDPGFRTDGLLTVKVSREQAGNRLDRVRALPPLHENVLARLRALPGVVAVSASNRLPFTTGGQSRTIADLHVSGEGQAFRKASFFMSADVTPDYFTTMGIPLLRGRNFTEHDTATSRPVVIVNERAAKQLWPNHDALGQRVTWGTPRPDNPSAVVIGVVGDIRSIAWEADRGLEFYYVYSQYPTDSLYYVIRTSLDPDSLIQAARQTIQATDRSIAVSAIKAMPQWVEESLWQTRLWSWLLGAFAGIALALAAVGLYGVVTYLVLLRSKEMVIRISVGATSNQIARLLFGSMLQLVGAGVVLGIAGSLAASRLIGSLLFQISPTDIRTYALVASVVIAIALLACCPPVLRTSRVNPASILKQE